MIMQLLDMLKMQLIRTDQQHRNNYLALLINKASDVTTLVIIKPHF